LKRCVWILYVDFRFLWSVLCFGYDFGERSSFQFNLEYNLFHTLVIIIYS
jgi:hypothetical protein